MSAEFFDKFFTLVLIFIILIMFCKSVFIEMKHEREIDRLFKLFSALKNETKSNIETPPKTSFLDERKEENTKSPYISSGTILKTEDGNELEVL